LDTMIKRGKYSAKEQRLNKSTSTTGVTGVHKNPLGP